jgi:hypothetical protein
MRIGTVKQGELIVSEVLIMGAENVGIVQLWRKPSYAELCRSVAQ